MAPTEGRIAKPEWCGVATMVRHITDRRTTPVRGPEIVCICSSKAKFHTPAVRSCLCQNTKCYSIISNLVANWFGLTDHKVLKKSSFTNVVCCVS